MKYLKRVNKNIRKCLRRQAILATLKKAGDNFLTVCQVEYFI